MFNKKKKLDNNSFKNGVGLVTYHAPTSTIAEQFRTVRTNIQFSSLNQDLKSIVFTSSEPSEGKSTVSHNVAVTWADQGKRTLIVDADLRRPTSHKTFGITNTFGLSNVLVGAGKLEQAVYETAIDNLYVLPSGPVPPNPSELLSSPKMVEVLKELSDNFDLIVVDAPPVNTVTDAQILASITDGTVLVVPQGIADKNGVRHAKQLLEAVHANILGAIMNRVTADNSVGYYGGYYGVDDK